MLSCNSVRWVRSMTKIVSSFCYFIFCYMVLYSFTLKTFGNDLQFLWLVESELSCWLVLIGLLSDIYEYNLIRRDVVIGIIVCAKFQ
jgi:hypothetical protein